MKVRKIKIAAFACRVAKKPQREQHSLHTDMRKLEIGRPGGIYTLHWHCDQTLDLLRQFSTFNLAIFTHGVKYQWRVAIEGMLANPKLLPWLIRGRNNK